MDTLDDGGTVESAVLQEAEQVWLQATSLGSALNPTAALYHSANHPSGRVEERDAQSALRQHDHYAAEVHAFVSRPDAPKGAQGGVLMNIPRNINGR